MLRRSGVSLVELLVALALGGIVLAAAGSSTLRQQRGARWVEGMTGAELQLRPVLRALPDEIAQLDAGAGDLAAGQANDSSLQVRSVVASTLACDTATASLTLLPETSNTPSLGGQVRIPAAGDSVWLYGGDSLGWRGRSVVASARVTAGCSSPSSAAGSAYRLTLDAPASASGGTPIRVTRWERWVVYRAGDGRWYVGIRDWSASTARFLAPQPVAGPFVRTLAGGPRTGFRYFDASGGPLTLDGTNERDVARVRVTTVSTMDQGGTARDGVRVDSSDAVLSRRGAT